MAARTKQCFITRTLTVHQESVDKTCNVKQWKTSWKETTTTMIYFHRNYGFFLPQTFASKHYRKVCLFQLVLVSSDQREVRGMENEFVTIPF